MKKVRDCYKSMSKGLDVVQASASVEEVIKSVSRDATSRSVFVVAEEGALLGIIQVREILSLLGGRYLDNVGLASARDYSATRASDIMGPPVSVTPDTDLEEALRIAVQNDLHDIPVVEDDRIVGNLDCLEIIVNYR